MFNAPFQHEASHDASSINTNGLRVRFRQSARVCGNIYFTKLLSAQWQAGVSTAGEHRACLSTLEHRCRVLCPAPCSPLGLALKSCKLLAFLLHRLYFMGIHKHDEQPPSPILHSLCYRGVDGATLGFLYKLKAPTAFLRVPGRRKWCAVFRSRCVCDSRQLFSDVCKEEGLAAGFVFLIDLYPSAISYFSCISVPV